MLNYLNNNLNLIKYYETLYGVGINVNSIISKLKNGDLPQHDSIDYSRFRVFIDSCMLIHNKEKLKKYAKNKFSFREYLDKVKKDEDMQFYIKIIQNHPLTSNINDLYFFYSLDGENKNPWDQIAIIRNAMAHMQYGGFSSTEVNGFLICYFLYNKDKGIRKNYGIVFESILHQFIQAFFSNYSYGLLYKYNFFTYNNAEKHNKKITLKRLAFYKVSFNDNYKDIYNGYNENLLSKLAKTSDDVKKFQLIEENKSLLLVEKHDCAKEIKQKTFNRFTKNYKLNSFNEQVYGLKTLIDFNSEFSNFLVHLVQLNEVLYEFSLLNATEKLLYQKKFEEKLTELVEDKDKKFSFEIGFALLRAINLSLRIEDDDYLKLDYNKVDVSMFEYDKIAFQRFKKSNNVNENMLERYVIGRMRNALMHGNISLALDLKGEVVLNFWDKYNKREENVSIPLKLYKRFLSQESLYYAVPKDTLVLDGSKT